MGYKKLFFFLTIFAITPPSVLAENVWQYITVISGETIGIIWRITVGSEGSVCFHGFNGAYRYSNSRWEKIYSCYQSNAYGVAIDSKGTVWKAEYGKISTYVDGAWVQIAPDISTEFILTRHLSIGLDGKVWVAGGNGLYQYNGSGWKRYTAADGLNSTYVEYILTAPDGDIWCTHGDYSSTFCDPGPCPPGGISRFHNGKWMRYDDSDGLASSYVYSIISGMNGCIYAVSYNGISRFANETWEKMLLISDRACRMSVGPDGVVWKTDGKTLFHYDEEICVAHEGMPGQIVALNLTVGHDGSVWLGTTNGIVRYNPSGIVLVTEAHPSKNILLSTHPNPFNPSTTIRFELGMPGRVSLVVYNALGQQVKQFELGRKNRGTHEFLLDGAGLPSGVYFYRVDAGVAAATGRMVLMK